MDCWLSLLHTDVGRDAQRPHYCGAHTTSSCSISSWVSKARKLTSVFMQLCIDASSSTEENCPLVCLYWIMLSAVDGPTSGNSSSSSMSAVFMSTLSDS